MTDDLDDRSDNGSSSKGRAVVELAADVWFIIMGLLSPSDLANLSYVSSFSTTESLPPSADSEGFHLRVRPDQTSKTLLMYSQQRYVWHNALLQHHFLPKSYPYLGNAPTSVIRHQLITTARVDAAFSRDTLKPFRSYSFPIEFPGVFQGIKFVPGSDWLVLLFHSRTLNPARHSNICLFKPPRVGQLCTVNGASTPTSVTLQSDMCWLHIRPRDGPYKSSRGDDLLLLRTFVKSDRTFAICHLDTKKPSINITFTINTTVETRNHTVAGDYLMYGWITDDRKHMVRIMKLNEDYTKLVKDVVAEIDCPPGHDGKLMVRYDLRLSGKRPRLLLVTTRLMAAYDISDDILTSGYQASPSKLLAVWKYIPERVSFGRILRVFHEGAIVILYEGKIKFIYPEIDGSEPNLKMIARCEFPSSTPYSTKFPAVFTPQRIFWPLRLPCPCTTGLMGTKHLIETAMLPAPNDKDCKINRILLEHDELSPDDGNSMACDAQDWDELSGRLCIRYVRSRFPNDNSWRKTNWRIAILEVV